MEVMPEFEAQVPHPLAENLPGLLTAGGVRTPAVGVLLFVLIGKHGLESASMQVQIHDIGRGKRVLRQGSEEQLIDDSLADRSDGVGSGGRLMGSDNYPAPSSRCRERDIGAIEEGARVSRFRMRRLLVRWQGQAGLHLGQIEEIIVLATHHIAKPEPFQILHNGAVAILSIQTHDPLDEWNMLGSQIGTDRLPRVEQIAPVIAIPSAGKRPKPLVRMDLENRRAGPDHLAALAPHISWSADFVEARLRCWEVGSSWHRSLSRGLPRSIDIEHEPMLPLPIPQTSWFLFFDQGASREIFQEECAQRVNGGLVNRREKATER